MSKLTYEDPFSLYKNIREIQLANYHMLNTLFDDTTNQKLFSAFKNKYFSEDNFTSEIHCRMQYFSCVYNCYIKYQKAISPSLFFDYCSNNYVKEHFVDHSFEIITNYYTLRYLAQGKHLYPYSDFKDLQSTSEKLFKLDSSNNNSNYKYYCLKNKKSVSPVQSNHLRYLREADNNIFCNLINCKKELSYNKKGSKYFISSFLPLLSYELAEKISTFNYYNFKNSLEENCSKDMLKKEVESLLNAFWTITEKLFNKGNYLSNICLVYKLEYAFGFFSTFIYFQNLKSDFFIKAHKSQEQDIKYMEQIINDLLFIQTHPHVFSPFRSGLRSHDELQNEYKQIIFSSKLFFILMLDLYDNRTKDYFKALKETISYQFTFYASQEQMTGTYPASHQGYNGWHAMYFMLRYIARITEEDKSFFCNCILSTIDALSSEETSYMIDFFLMRYSPEWFDYVKTLFNTDIKIL